MCRWSSQEAVDRLVEVARTDEIGGSTWRRRRSPRPSRIGSPSTPLTRSAANASMEGLDEIRHDVAQDTAIFEFEAGMAKDRPLAGGGDGMNEGIAPKQPGGPDALILEDLPDPTAGGGKWSRRGR